MTNAAPAYQKADNLRWYAVAALVIPYDLCVALNRVEKPTSASMIENLYKPQCNGPMSTRMTAHRKLAEDLSADSATSDKTTQQSTPNTRQSREECATGSASVSDTAGRIRRCRLDI